MLYMDGVDTLSYEQPSSDESLSDESSCNVLTEGGATATGADASTATAPENAVSGMTGSAHGTAATQGGVYDAMVVPSRWQIRLSSSQMRGAQIGIISQSQYSG